MNTVAIKPAEMLNTPKRVQKSAKPVYTAEEMEDAVLLALMEEGLKTPSVSHVEVMKALKR